MTGMLFYKGQGVTLEEAVSSALSNITPILLQNPSLVIELLELNQTGHHWESHIRLMAVKTTQSGDGKGRNKKKTTQSLELTPKSPEHFHSGQPFEWRPVGMKHDNLHPSFGFDRATYGGNVPDIPTQDIEIYKRAGWSDGAIRYRLSLQEDSTSPDLEDEPKLQVK